MTLDVDAIRAQFPILTQTGPDGRPLVYFDNAASSQKPRAVIDAISRYYERHHANVHRGVHTLSRRATEAFEAGRAELAAFLNASPDEVVFTRGATEALNLAAHALAPRLAPGDGVLLTELEHHSNIVPWQLVRERTGAVIHVVPVLPDGSLDLDAFHRLLAAHPIRVAAFGHVSNALGTIHPVAELAAAARDAGAIVVVDGAQGAAHGSVDVQALGADLYALSGHKMYGPTGIGALWGRRALLAELPPWQGGGEMIETVTFERTTWAAPPARFEAGTPNIAGAIGLGAAAAWIREVGPERIAAHEAALLERATRALHEIPGLRIHGTAPRKAAVLSFTVDGVHPHDLGTLLDELGIAVRTGHHCAQPLMAALGVDSTARASFAAYNTLDEVDRFADALVRVLRILR